MSKSLMVIGAFPEIREATQSIQKYCGEEYWDVPRIHTEWNHSRSVMTSPLTYQPGDPIIKDIPPEYIEQISAITGNQSFTQIAQGQWSIRLVQVDALLSQPIFVNLDYIEELQVGVRGNNFEDVIRLCLPNTPKKHIFQQSQNEISLFTRDRGVRWGVQGSVLNVDQGGTVVGFPMVLDNGPVHVKSIHGKYVLVDGYHRALAIRKAGYEYIPCLLTEAHSPNEIVTMGQESFNIPFLLESANPPTLGVFLTEAAVEVHTRPMGKLIKIKIEETYVLFPYK